MSVRVDSKTGKTYTFHNIPVTKEAVSTSGYKDGVYYKIISQNHSHPDDSWYNGRFIGDRYAVFEWVKTSAESGFWQQYSRWYNRFGNALRKLSSCIG